MRPLLLSIPFVVMMGLAAADQSAAQIKGTDLLVTPAWLNGHLKDPDLVILHVGERPRYAEAHIAGARFVELSAVDGTRGAQGEHLVLEMPEPADLRTRLEQLGISDDSRIVVVQAQEYFSPSTRVMFTLRYAGLGNRVSWLDGGLAGWTDAGFPVTAQVPEVKPGRITKAADPSLIVDHAFVQGLSKGGGRVRLIDAREPMFFEGPSHGTMKAGHIPGAANLPFNSLAGDDQKLLPKAELERRFRAAGVEPGDTVVAYCHFGQQATMVLFAATVLGHPVKLYDGSMDDWGKRKLPTEGAKP